MLGAVTTTTAADGAPLGYWTRGHGAPVLLVHGSVSDHTVWRPLLPALERRFTVHAMNRRGRPGSAPLLDGDLEREFRDVACVVEALDAPAHVIGHSFGGLCALGAALHTERIRSLVLYEPPPPSPEVRGLERSIRELVDAGRTVDALESFLREGPGGRDLERLRRSEFWDMMRESTPTLPNEIAALGSASFDPQRFEALEVPIRFLVGTESPSYLRVVSDAVAALRPRAEVVEMPGEGHFTNLLDPDRFLAEVLPFLA